MTNLCCNNVGGLEDCFNNIEAGLWFMNTLLTTNGIQKPSVETAAEDGNSGGLCAYVLLTDTSTYQSSTSQNRPSWMPIQHMDVTQ